MGVASSSRPAPISAWGGPGTVHQHVARCRPLGGRGGAGPCVGDVLDMARRRIGRWISWVSTKTGTLSWWSPFHRLAVPRCVVPR